VEGSKDVIVAVDEEFLLVGQNHLAATVLGKEHRVSHLHQVRACCPIIHGLAWPDGDDSAEVELLLLAGSENDTSLGLGESLGLLDDDAIEHGSDGFECKHLLIIK
jgi:hypothetical protein